MRNDKMWDKNEIVKIEMSPGDRLRLQGQINERMKKLGLDPGDWNSLDLGFELSDGWPVDMNDQPTISELTVFACKLKMRVIIADLNMVPANYDGPNNEK